MSRQLRIVASCCLWLAISILAFAPVKVFGADQAPKDPCQHWTTGQEDPTGALAGIKKNCESQRGLGDQMIEMLSKIGGQLIEVVGAVANAIWSVILTVVQAIGDVMFKVMWWAYETCKNDTNCSWVFGDTQPPPKSKNLSTPPMPKIIRDALREIGRVQITAYRNAAWYIARLRNTFSPELPISSLAEDINQDGKLDWVLIEPDIYSTKGKIVMRIVTSESRTGPRRITQLEEVPLLYRYLLRDVNRDGKKDLLVHDEAGQLLHHRFGNGQGVFGEPVDPNQGKVEVEIIGLQASVWPRADLTPLGTLTPMASATPQKPNGIPGGTMTSSVDKRSHTFTMDDLPQGRVLAVGGYMEWTGTEILIRVRTNGMEHEFRYTLRNGAPAIFCDLKILAEATPAIHCGLWTGTNELQEFYGMVN